MDITKNKPISIVLDKCFLQGLNDNSQIKIEDIVKDHRLLLTAELMIELGTSNDASLKKCFEILKKHRDVVDIIDHLGTLLAYEIKNHIPAVPLSNIS